MLLLSGSKREFYLLSCSRLRTQTEKTTQSSSAADIAFACPSRRCFIGARLEAAGEKEEGKTASVVERAIGEKTRTSRRSSKSWRASDGKG